MADYARNRMFFASSTTLMLGVAAYMAFSLFWHRPVPEAWRWPLTLGLLALSQCITAMRVLVTLRPDLPFALIRAGGFVSASFMALSWLVLLRDVPLALLLALSAALPEICGPAVRALLSLPFEFGMLAAAPALAALGMFRALRVPRLRRVRVTMPGLAPELDGLRLVLLSDLHIGSAFGGDWLSAVVRRANEADPDLVLIAGDLADGSPTRIGRHLRPLLDLRARFGVMASPGNHDYYSGLGPWLNTWRSWGLPMLMNQHRDFRIRGRRVTVAGVTDPCARHFPSLGPNMAGPDTRRALMTAYPAPPSGEPVAQDASFNRAAPAEQSGDVSVELSPHERPAVALPAPRQTEDERTDSQPGGTAPGAQGSPDLLPGGRADLTILLAHRPGDAARNAALGVDLQLSGHTHGGQFFFLFPLVHRMNAGFRSGLYRVDGMPLYVSPGTGMWGYVPMRFGTSAEITLLVLERAR